jgi:hypothetical protein
VETSAPSARPALASIPRAGDVVHVSVDGAERATAAYDGRPAFDDDCSPEGASVSGSLPPGASLEVRQADFVDGDGTAGSVTAAGDRFTATFPRRLRGAPVQVTANATVPRTDGGTAGVHVRHWTAISCQDGTGPQKTVHLAITGGKPLRAVHVDRRGRFVLARRTRCPQELPRCRVGVGVQAALPGGRSGKVLGGLAYTVRGGSNARVHGRLRPAALAGLRRKGARRVAFSVVIRPPKQMPKGIHATGLHAGYDGRLIAP